MYAVERFLLVREQEEHRDSAILDSTCDAFCLVDQENRISAANRTLANLFGCHPEHLRGAPVSSFQSESATGARISFIDEVRKSGSARAELTLSPADDILIPVEVSGSLLTDTGEVALFFRDVTPHNLDNERLSACIENTPDVAVRWLDREGTIIYWNGAAQQVFGWSAAEALGSAADDLGLGEPGGLAPGTLLMGLVRSGGSRGPEERVYRDKNGKEVICRSTLCSIPSDSGEPHFVYMDMDITEVRQHERQLRDSEQRFRDLFERSPDPIFVESYEGVVLDCNSAACQLHGLPRADLIGRHVSQLVPPHHKEHLEEGFQKFVSGELTTSEGFSLGPNGEQIPVELRAANIQFQNQPALLFHVRDISKRKHVEDDLRESESRFRFLVEGIPQVYWLAESNPDRMIYVSPAGPQVFGIPQEVVYKDPWAWIERVHPNDQDMVRASVVNWMEKGDRSLDIEFRVIHPDESIRWVRTRSTHRESRPGRPTLIAGIAEDITEQKLAAEENEAFDRRLQETAKLESLGVLAGGIAHDFNNLLTGILGNASLARMQLAPEAPLQSTIAEIEAASMRAADLCRQMLAYSGRGKLQAARISLGNLVQKTTRLLNFSISKKAILRYDLAPKLPPILGDAAQLQQVVMNLVINASEALGDTGGEIILKADLIHADAAYLADAKGAGELPFGEYVRFEIRDAGSGMPPETLERIFEPFFTTKFTGRGLGLSAVLGIVRNHKGAVKVTSKPGGGTTFTLLFPPVEGEASLDPEKVTVNSTWNGKGLILVVDDEEPVRRVAEIALAKFGFDVITAKDGVEGVERFRAASHSISAVLLDLTMPRLDGSAVLEAIQAINPRVPVILMSGFDEQEILDRFAARTVAGFLQKPFSAHDIAARLETVLNADGAIAASK
jgi:PAS domain S-box-containing protein